MTKTTGSPRIKRTIDEYDARLIVQTDFGWALLMEEQPKRHDLLWKRKDGVYKFTAHGWFRMDGEYKFIELKT